MKIIKSILLGASIPILYTIAAFVAGFRHSGMLAMTLGSTFALGYLIFGIKDKGTNRKRYFLFVLPLCLLIGVPMILDSDMVVRAAPYVLFIPVFALLALWARQKRWWWSFFIAIPLAVWLGLVGFNNWFSFYVNFDSHVEKPLPPLELVDHQGQPVELPKDKVVVLDLWTTSCGVCFKKFPAVEEQYLAYKDDPRIQFYSVNIPIKRDTLAKTKKFVEKLGYQFETIYSMEQSPTVRGKLDFGGYPQLFILKAGKIRYEGHLVTEKGVIVHSSEE